MNSRITNIWTKYTPNVNFEHSLNKLQFLVKIEYLEKCCTNTIIQVTAIAENNDKLSNKTSVFHSLILKKNTTTNNKIVIDEQMSKHLIAEENLTGYVFK